MVHIPFDCLRMVIDLLDVEDVLNACLALSNTRDISELLRCRMSPLGFLGMLVQDPMLLLNYMRTYQSVLVGSKAAEYFCRNSSTDSSSWDFLVKGDSDCRGENSREMKKALGLMGVQWNQTTEFYKLHGEDDFRVIAGSMTVGKGRGQSIQLITSRENEPMSHILSLHSTPVQCMITHHCAIHLYGKLSSERKQVIWHRTIRHREERVRAHNLECVVHYSLRRLELFIHEGSVLKDVLDLVYHTKTEYCKRNRYDPSTATRPPDGFRAYMEASIVSLSIPEHNRILLLGCVTELSKIAFHQCHCTNDLSKKAADSYTSRGYNKTKFAKYRDDSGPWYGNGHRIKHRSRTARDSETTLVSFERFGLPYYDDRTTEETKSLSSFEWYEYHGVATDHPVNSSSDIFFIELQLSSMGPDTESGDETD